MRDLVLCFLHEFQNTGRTHPENAKGITFPLKVEWHWFYVLRSPLPLPLQGHSAFQEASVNVTKFFFFFLKKKIIWKFFVSCFYSFFLGWIWWLPRMQWHGFFPPLKLLLSNEISAVFAFKHFGPLPSSSLKPRAFAAISRGLHQHNRGKMSL